MAVLGAHGRSRAAAAVISVGRRPPLAVAAPPGCRAGRRWLHKGHVGSTLEKLDLPKHKWLKEVDQAPEKSGIRRQKDKYLREMGAVNQDMQALFSDDPMARKSVEPFTQEELKQTSGSTQRKEDVNEALRMYRLLRPDAPPFYEEDSMYAMQAKMNKVLLDEAPTGDKDALEAWEEANGKRGGALFDPFKTYMPVVNQRAFLLALESVVASLAEDVETMCLLAGLSQEELPREDDPLRFKLLLDALFGAFPLRKDPSRVDEFMENHWPRLRNLLPEEIARLDQDRVADWLRGHLRRVKANQRRHMPKILLHTRAERFGDEEWYSFAEDFPYDDDPMPGLLADERNLDFPLERAGDFMASLLGALSRSPVAMEARQAEEASGGGGGGRGGEAHEGPGVAEQFQDFVWDLEKVGLRNWLKMDIAELEKFLPKGELAELHLPSSPSTGAPAIKLDGDDVEVAKMMLRCAARGRPDLLDFEAVDPYKLLHNLPAREVDEELASLPANAHLGDGALASLVDAHTERLRRRDIARGGGAERTPTQKAWLNQGATIDEIYRKELDFYRTAGPVEWNEAKEGEYSWKWRQPPNTFWDPQSKTYIQERKGVDPTLNLKEMRQHLLDMNRMSGMVKSGRVNYFRAIVVVGNGKGIYGFGVGFGNTPKETRADAAVKALQNLDYIDMDHGRMLPFPTKGMEYKHSMKIVPRPIGRGLKANKKFLPLLYILGLDNCKVSFMHSKIFTRIRAVKRALDGIISRRTLANMTGQRYSLLVAPGDHWVHWPDRWFQEIRKPYDSKVLHTKLMRKHRLHFKNRSNVVATELEVRPGWRKENWARWNNSLERWLQERRGARRTSKSNDPVLGSDPLVHLERGKLPAAQ
mmetsp:Transcript_95368/g.308999  ORF Transcript_95368/g.308999 Transcript_95368/m.308999 type:complete len:871 (-) Transcript_95368:102-2714(-)